MEYFYIFEIQVYIFATVSFSNDTDQLSTKIVPQTDIWTAYGTMLMFIHSSIIYTSYSVDTGTILSESIIFTFVTKVLSNRR